MMLAAILGLLAASQGPAEASTRAAIARVERLDRKVHAVLALNPWAIADARALDRSRRARGPLHGMPILLKDNVEASGVLPTTAGSLALARNVTNRDAPIVARLRGAGAVILGKTNLSEWANIRSSNSTSGWSAVGGQTHNPHAFDRNPCGSSSGSAAAVAAGMVDAAVGTETDGSITCPASVNGVVGLKPTVGLVSRSRIVPISRSQDTAGPLAKDVATAARLLNAIAGSDPSDPATREADARKSDYAAGLRRDALHGARIGVVRLEGWSPAVQTLFEAALAVLRAQGAVLVDIAPPDRAGTGADELVVLLAELKAGLNAYLATTPSAVRTRTLADVITFNRAHAARELALFDQDLFERAEATAGMGDSAYLQARARSLLAARENGLDRMLTGSDLVAIVAPTVSPAWKTDVVNGDQVAKSGIGYLAAVAGYPHLSVPMGRVRGLPVGMSFIGPAWSEGHLLGLGYAYEQAAKVKMPGAVVQRRSRGPRLSEASPRDKAGR